MLQPSTVISTRPLASRERTVADSGQPQRLPTNCSLRRRDSSYIHSPHSLVRQTIQINLKIFWRRIKKYTVMGDAEGSQMAADPNAWLWPLVERGMCRHLSLLSITIFFSRPPFSFYFTNQFHVCSCVVQGSLVRRSSRRGSSAVRNCDVSSKMTRRAK